jgi:hypothetical protein
MNEHVEFRIPEENARLYLGNLEGKKLGGTVRRLEISVDDPRYEQIGRIERQFLSEGKPFFLGWQIKRQYSQEELDASELFSLDITAVFEPSGEECGTVYDESGACSICGANRRQVSDLILDLRKIPKSKGIARTIADEWIVSQQLADLMIREKISGFELHPVRHKARYRDDAIDLSKTPTGREIFRLANAAGLKVTDWGFYVWLNNPEQRELVERHEEEYIKIMGKKNLRKAASLPVWYQLIVTSSPTLTIAPTRFGVNPFDDDPEEQFKCPLGHVSGLNLLSEVWIPRSAWDGSDIIKTENLVGIRRGVLIPTPLLLISPRLWRLLKRENIKGYKVEIAHLT